MDKQQQSQITELRQQGLGYGVIAKQMNLTKGAVGTFCRRHDLGSNGKLLKLVRKPSVRKPRPEPIIICDVTVTYEPWQPAPQ